VSAANSRKPNGSCSINAAEITPTTAKSGRELSWELRAWEHSCREIAATQTANAPCGADRLSHLRFKLFD
jgi:hypothetical protein